MKTQTKKKASGNQAPKYVAEPVDSDSQGSSGEGISDDGEDLMANAQAYSDEISDEDSEVDSEEEADELPHKKPTADGKYKVPTAEEVAAIMDVGDQFGSNLFKMQIDELLDSAVMKFGSQPRVDASLKSIKKTLDSLPEFTDLTATEATKKIKDIPFPEPRPGTQTQYRFSSQPPSNVQLVGSYPLGTLLKSDSTIDLAVEMPSELFQEKDYVNHRYFHKRAFYIAAVAEAFKKAKDPCAPLDLKRQAYTYVDSDLRRPVLTLTLTDPSCPSKEILVRILPAVDSAIFSTKRLAPHQNNVRPPSGDALPPTPRYNTSLARDMVFTAHMTFLHTLTKQCKEFSQAIVLVKAWSECRGFGTRGSTCKGFSGLLASMLLAYLLQPSAKSTTLSPSLSSYQLFKGLLDFLSSDDLSRPILLGSAIDKEMFSAQSFKTHFLSAGAVVVGPTGLLHLAPYMTRSDWAYLKQEAKHSLDMMKLPDAHSNLFQALFVDKRHTMELKYDHVISFQPPSQLPEDWHSEHQKLDCPDAYMRLVEHLPGFLMNALGERVTLAICHFQEAAAETQPLVHVGLLVNPDHAWRLVDRGPSPHDDPDAAQKFRELWGGKAELRRFQDGSIVESLVWTCAHVEDRRSILKQMISYLLKRHLKVGLTRFWGDQLRQPLRLSKNSARGSTYLKDTTRGFQPAIEAFDGLVRAVKQAPLPLSISAIAANAPGLRYTSTFMPQPISLEQLASLPTTDRYIEPMDAVIDFEPSARWPEDLDAIQKLKTALLLEIKRYLDGQDDVVAHSTVVQGLAGPEVPMFAADTHLDVLADGFLFRLRIRCTVEEEFLLDRLSLAAKKGHSALAFNQLEKALLLYRQRFGYKLWAAPRLHGLCQSHPTLSFTIRLVKKWISAHMLTSHFSPEAIELACAAVFFDPMQFSTLPNSPVCGFARVLSFLSLYNFEMGPIPVKLPGLELNPHLPSILTGEDFGGVDHLSKKRRTDKSSLVPFVAPVLSDGNHLLHQDLAVPTAVINRVKQLATATLASMRSLLNCTSGESDEAKVLSWFVTPTKHFDIVLELKPELLSRRYQTLLLPKSKTKMGASAFVADGEITSLSQLRADFDPVEIFLEELKLRYASFLHFFYGHCGGTSIGIVIDRTSRVLDPAPLRTLVPYPHCPISFPVTSNLTKLHLEVVWAEIRRLGQGLISDLIIQKDL
ncbi:U3 snoRNP protein [Entomophthora muscae]|uniref:U3 snoRNP protein n=1 Tax=Entomophthora muscae TaxID=34485 RepID=A0ACC2TZF8_9FUNG|nr:U3 snoRNP protein [Entomophthora muscae]